ncbi:DUF6143 family protein [Ammoniphilus resinae]|uniref:Uncharacterized protein n=1 Tax=Ammoniphilus resinae TaxID=861532 RepID=A0ABS4GSF3_9BACL|nr:DUF6143 family protein [Ammoniphilus resinae]MBP1933179.1 hypothetical protein [Ammoniphilus resinae]
MGKIIRLPEVATVPQSLYRSLRGKYFIAYADNLTFGRGTSAWARLYNPPNSGVNLFVNVWTVTDVATTPFRVQFWFNAKAPGTPINVRATPTNLKIKPLPKPRVKIQLTRNVKGNPKGGIKAFVRRAVPEQTLVEEEGGKLIFPPGSNFLVFVSNPETPRLAGNARIAFGWWEEKIIKRNK